MSDNEETKQETEYSIDLEWLRQNDRSFVTLARARVCPECRQKAEGEVKEERLLSLFSQCCSQAPEFINPHQPLTEAVFRLFLAKGNEPMNAEEISKELGKWRVGETRHIDAKSLHRLLDAESFYGIKPVAQPLKTS